jgi:ribosomal protein S18 acetylase RimI-like enzyme
VDGLEVRPVGASDRPWVEKLIREHWGADIVVAHGEVYRPVELPAVVAMAGGDRVGLLSYQIDGAWCEIVTLDSLREGAGVGTALVDSVREIALEHGCARLWLITTNDNLHALGFYQRRGFELVAVHRNALERSRALKPEIPLVGSDRIPLRDEIELEMVL